MVAGTHIPTTVAHSVPPKIQLNRGGAWSFAANTKITSKYGARLDRTAMAQNLNACALWAALARASSSFAGTVAVAVRSFSLLIRFGPSSIRGSRSAGPQLHASGQGPSRRSSRSVRALPVGTSDTTPLG